MNESNAVTGLYKWFGAIIYYCLSFGEIPFEEHYSEKYKWRNICTGYALTMVCLFLGIVCLVLKTS